MSGSGLKWLLSVTFADWQIQEPLDYSSANLQKPTLGAFTAAGGP